MLAAGSPSLDDLRATVVGSPLIASLEAFVRERKGVCACIGIPAAPKATSPGRWWRRIFKNEPFLPK
jgi:hypothetical protein